MTVSRCRGWIFNASSATRLLSRTLRLSCTSSPTLQNAAKVYAIVLVCALGSASAIPSHAPVEEGNKPSEALPKPEASLISSPLPPSEVLHQSESTRNTQRSLRRRLERPKKCLLRTLAP